MLEPLFRQEALDAQAAAPLGRIVLVPRPTATVLSLGFALAALAILAFLAFGTYTRRVTVTGQLVPATGMMRIHAPQPGVVVEKHVQEGQAVKAGDVLYVLSSDRPALDSAGFQATVVEQVGARKRSMESEIASNRKVEAGEIAQLEQRAATLRAESGAIARQMEQQRVRLKLAAEARDRYRALADKDFVPREQYDQKEMELSDQQSRLHALERDALATQRELAATVRDIETTRSRYGSQNATLQRGIATSKQELAENEAKRRIVITAPGDGRATLVAAEIGQAVDPTRPLVAVVPAGAKLQARLYAASRSIGFVREHDPVLLRYQSFPFQKFGQYAGEVSSVSAFAVPATEFAGIGLPDVPAGEPVYAITVDLREQAVDVAGQPRALTAGMRVDADVMQETRRLYEWMLEPLYAMKGRT